MPVAGVYKDKIDELKRKFEQLPRGKESLLEQIDVVEISTAVYNSPMLLKISH